MLNSTRLICLIGLFLPAASLCAQNFSKITDATYISEFKLVENSSYGYWTLGQYTDNSYDETAALLFVAFDFNGDTLFTKKYEFENYHVTFPSNTGGRINDSTVIAVVEKFNPSFELGEYIMDIIWFNNLGDTLQTKSYASPYYVENVWSTNWNRPNSVCIDQNNQVFYICNEVWESDPEGKTFIVRKFDSFGNVIWTYAHPPFDNYSFCKSISLNNDQIWIMAKPDTWSDGPMLMIQLATDNGEIVNDFEIVEFNAQPSDFHIDSTGIYLNYLSSIGQIPITRIAKIDNEGEVLWTSGPEIEYAFNQFSKHIIGSNFGEYVVCSIKQEQVANNFNQIILLWKVDLNGQILWVRTYSFFDFSNPANYQMYNLANDIQMTPDGGFVCAGASRINCTNYPECTDFFMQGWILKLDACGCLVPGCDENCTVAVAENNEVDNQSLFLVGPNPAQDFLNIYLKEISGVQFEDIVFEIFDPSGKLVKSFSPYRGDTTYLLDTNDINSGEYLLLLKKGNELLQSQKIVVMK
ncbi:MAG: T9SS type A sorting domain-containing protein [Flavobacteriales bacterium]